MDKLFKVGEKAKLKSGGPIMTIKENKETYFTTKEFRGEVVCTWFDGSKLEAKLFNQELLDKVD